MQWANPPLAGLPVLVVLALVLALAAPLHLLLFLDVLLSLFPGRWEIAGVLVDPSDVTFAALVLGLVLRARRTNDGEKIPHLGLWLLLGCLLSLSYLRAPDSQPYLTGPLEILYQLYRYCWKGLLYYPLAVVLLARPERFRKLILVVIAVGVLFSIQAIPGGYAGERGGPLLGGNALGLALHFPLLATLALLSTADRRGVKVWSSVALILIVRGLTFSASRGAFLAALVGAAVLFGLLVTRPGVRPRLARLAAGFAVLAAVLLVVTPDLLERPTFQRFGTLTSAPDEDSTLSWRMEERWPHFWDKALAHPWLGVATDIDPALGAVANTPHNGYLSLAVSHGFPALAIVLAFAWLGVRGCLRLLRLSDHPGERLFGAVGTASLAALLVHNLVDNGFGLPFTAKLFWIFTALAIAGARRQTGPAAAPLEPAGARAGRALPEAGLAARR